jgi:dCMP deaminase
MHEKCRAIHAEQNLIVQAALHGVELKGSTIYCTTQPCSICMKMIAGVQPDKLVYVDEYPDEETFEILKQLARKEMTVQANPKFVKWTFYNWS